MYPYLCPNETCNPSHEHDNFVNFKPKQQVAFLSPAYPMPRQILYNNDGTIKKCPANAVVKSIMPDFDCCYLTMFFAASCRAIKRGDAHFLTRTNGTMHLTVGDFETLLDGWKLLGITEVPTCKDFTFL